MYALDSTTIDLCLSLFPWAHFRSTKAAVKMHTLLDLRGNIPSFIHISDGKLHDVHALDMLVPEAGAIYVMDRGYVDFARLHGLHQAGAFFVTRAKSNLNAHRVYSTATDRTTGMIADQNIALDGHYTQQRLSGPFTACAFQDPETGKTLVFLTNQTTLPALTICDLYKSRWQVELFFKWIKQHLRIKKFYGTSENAVKTQIWIAVSVYVLVAIVRKRLNLDASLYTLMQVFSVTVFEKSLPRPLEETADLVVPTITIYEVFKVVFRQRGESEALQSAALMEQGLVVDLTPDIAVLAARTSVEHHLPMADSIILATSRLFGATIWTQDSDFKEIEGVQYVAKKNG